MEIDRGGGVCHSVINGKKVRLYGNAGWGGGGAGQSLTFSTNTDFKHPGAETVSSWHTEALVSGVVFGTHEYVVGGCEAICLDAFHLHVFHIGEMDRPKERN